METSLILYFSRGIDRWGSLVPVSHSRTSYIGADAVIECRLPIDSAVKM